jgi:shikimate kinase
LTRSIIVVGPPGAGKTTVATQLSERLGVAMRDTDADVEASTGASVADLFVERGEEEFRKLEEQAVRSALEELLASDSGGVVALGGGAILSQDTRALLRQSPVQVVLLEVGLSQAVRRVGLGATRPLLLGNIRSTLKRLLDERAPLYREVADIVVDTDDLTPEQVADRVAELVTGATP